MSLIEQQNVTSVELFPSPLMSYFWENSEDLNDELAKVILSKEKRDEGILTTNVGGWHSRKDLQSWNEPCVQVLLTRIMCLGHEMHYRFSGSKENELFSGWTIQAWANINRRDNHNKFHNHVRNMNLWSGVYYVNMGVRDEDGVSEARIVFADQHQVIPKSGDGLVKRHYVVPKPGLMLLFPSSLGHRVENHLGSSERITVAFNLRNDTLTTINYNIENSKVKP